MNLRDNLALICIKLARRLTGWGETDDYLASAQRTQEAYIAWGKE